MYTKGVLMEVDGVGVHIGGDSGTANWIAVKLIAKNHCLVAADVVEYRPSSNGKDLMGTAANKTEPYNMEIYGLGMVNVSKLFGTQSVRDQTKIQLMVNLTDYNDLGIEEQQTDSLLPDIPVLVIPVKPDQDMNTIAETIESAARERRKELPHDD